MDDLDRTLARLAAAPAPAALEGIEHQVLARIGTAPVMRQVGLGFGTVAAVALAIGIIGAELPATAQPIVSLAPLGGASPLAPSSLLIGEP
jgi:anti-sigma factor RsiW